jgi:membrane protease YdiL (CAAX protease family)
MIRPRGALVAWPAEAVVAMAGLGLLALVLRPVGSLSPVVPMVVGAAALLVPLEASDRDVSSSRASERWLAWTAATLVGLGAVTGVALMAPVTPLSGGSLAVLGSVAAAVGEEAFFRRLLYGVLVRWGPPVAVAISAVAFAAIHVPAYGLPAAVANLGAGILFGWQRWASGGWSAPALTHAVANALALWWVP